MTREGSLRHCIETAIGATRKMIEPSTSGLFGTQFQLPGRFWTGPGTDAESDKIKEAIRLYVETWILPALEEAHAKVTKGRA